MAARSTPPAGPALGAEELAYLVGGAARVAEVALAGLLAYGRVRISSEGLLSVVHGAQTSMSPVQSLVLLAVGGRGRPAMTVLLEVARSKDVHRCVPGLKARRLVPEKVPKAQRKRRVTVPPPRTPTGEAAVQCAWHLAHGGPPLGHEVEALIDPGLLAWAAGLVAVRGLTAYPDPTIAAILSFAMTRAEADRKKSGEGGCGSYGCGSSCGGCGGGGGGGGCGGGCGG